MVNEKDMSEMEFEVTDEEHHNADDVEIAEEEHASADKIKQLRQKLQTCDEEKRHILEQAQRERADFLNARKRLETERQSDKLRFTKKHAVALLPLCDSFEMAMKDKDAWEKADVSWRKGIDGIYTQLKRLLESYGVHEIDSEGQAFDPRKHEAMGTTPVTDTHKQDTVVSVLQRGYEITLDGMTEVIRPARVTIGEYTEN